MAKFEFTKVVDCFCTHPNNSQRHFGHLNSEWNVIHIVMPASEVLVFSLSPQVCPVAQLPRPPVQALARPPRRERAARVGRLPVGKPFQQVLLPGRVGPGGHDGDNGAYKGGRQHNKCWKYWHVLLTHIRGMSYDIIYLVPKASLGYLIIVLASKSHS